LSSAPPEPTPREKVQAKLKRLDYDSPEIDNVAAMMLPGQQLRLVNWWSITIDDQTIPGEQVRLHGRRVSDRDEQSFLAAWQRTIRFRLEWKSSSRRSAIWKSRRYCGEQWRKESLARARSARLLPLSTAKTGCGEGLGMWWRRIGIVSGAGAVSRTRAIIRNFVAAIGAATQPGRSRIRDGAGARNPGSG
jgi:hypothetical protein